MMKIHSIIVLVPAFKINVRRNNINFLLNVQKFGLPQIFFQNTFATDSKGQGKQCKEKKGKVEVLRQPVPPLADTIAKFITSVKPLLSEEELENTKRAVEDFGKSGGCGEKLQAVLEERAKCHENWLQEWWLDTAYLGFRSTVVVHSSPGLVFPLQNFKCPAEQLNYAAQMISGALDYFKKIAENKIPPEFMGESPLDMSQYHKVFGTHRTPGCTKDELSYLDPANPPKHIIVLHNNHLFNVEVMDECGALPEETILKQLEELVKMSPNKGPALGILTATNRDDWGKAYTALSANESNGSSFCEIRKSLFVVCIDGPSPEYTKPGDQTGAGLQMVHGCGSKVNSANRWFDKTIQLIIGAEGAVGLCYEHSPAEGPPIANLMDHIVTYMEEASSKNSKCKDGKKTAAKDKCGNANEDKGNKCAKKAKKDDGAKVCPPKELEFIVCEDTCAAISAAECSLDQLVEDLRMSSFTFKCYGKDYIKSKKYSPDSFIQVAMQFAFFRLHKIPAVQYETASLRKFLHGRTETIRSCTCESVDFAKKILDSEVSAEDKVNALSTAVKAHKAYTLAALNGLGVDRHFLGLKLAAIEGKMDVPKLYSDVGFVRSSHFRISSSQVAAKSDGFMCYGPLVTDGYSVCYNPRANEIIFGITDYKSSPETDLRKFHEALVSSLEDMHDVHITLEKEKLKEKAKPKK